MYICIKTDLLPKSLINANVLYFAMVERQDQNGIVSLNFSLIVRENAIHKIFGKYIKIRVAMHYVNMQKR